MDSHTLLVPAKSDIERDKVAEAWEASQGPVLRLDRFSDRPDVEAATARVYGNDTFCLVVAQVLELDLVSPPDDFLIGLDDRWLRRKVEPGEVELPETVVLDVGVVEGNLVVVEANATWGGRTERLRPNSGS